MIVSRFRSYADTTPTPSPPAPSTSDTIATNIGAAGGTFLQRLLLPQTTTQIQPKAPPPSSGGIFGIPKTIMWVGGTVLVLGLGVYLFTRWRRGKRSVSGYRRYRR